MRTDRGERPRALAAGEDRRRELEMGTERTRLEAALQSLEDGLFILDRSGQVTFANAAAEELVAALGAGVQNAFNEACARRSGRRARTCLECLANCCPAARPGVVCVGDRLYDVRITPLRDPGGVEAGRVVLCRDVTEVRRQAAREAHEERLSVLGQLAAVTAHELNNPLAAIAMFSRMLLDEIDGGSPLAAHAEVVHRNTMRCTRTLHSLLDLAVTAAAAPADFDVRDLVDEVVELLTPVAAQAGTALVVDAETADGVVRGDEIQLRQAVINLVLNAVQAAARAEAGEVGVGTLERGGEVVIRVRDNGPGVPAELRERIFEPFFTTKPAGEGTGLGLPTSRRIVEAQGGRLVLDPGAADGGAVFAIVLPRAAAVAGGQIGLERAS
jgi:signal transduction histidine kinase